jgi:hypothetical protein
MSLPPGEGWKPWLRPFPGFPGDDSPYSYAKVEVWRQGWKDPVIQRPYDNPEGNAVGLYWRPYRPAKSEDFK